MVKVWAFFFFVVFLSRRAKFSELLRQRPTTNKCDTNEMCILLKLFSMFGLRLNAFFGALWQMLFIFSSFVLFSSKLISLTNEGIIPLFLLLWIHQKNDHFIDSTQLSHTHTHLLTLSFWLPTRAPLISVSIGNIFNFVEHTQSTTTFHWRLINGYFLLFINFEYSNLFFSFFDLSHSLREIELSTDSFSLFFPRFK